MSFCKRRCKGTAIFSNYQIIPYYIIYFFVGLYVSSIIFSKTSCLGGRNTNPSNRSMNSLRSDSISHFVAQIAHRNQRLNIDSKDLHSSKDLLVRIVFREYIRGNMEHRAVIGFAASSLCHLD